MITNSNLDLAGIVASAACAVHCAAVPVLIAIGSMSGSHWLHNHMFDYFFILVGIIFAGFALLRAREKHNSNRPLSIALLGFGVLIMAQFDHGLIHSVLGVSGGLLIVASHLINWRLSHQRIA